MIRCITPNEQEDFILLNRRLKVIRSYTNAANRNSDKVAISRHRKIKIADNEKSDDKKTNIERLGPSTREFHSAVGSKDNDYLLLFSRFDLIKMKIDV